MKELDESSLDRDWVTIGCHQRDILYLLKYCPLPLSLKEVANLLSSSNASSTSYFQIWRSRTKLTQKGLTQRLNKKGYVITAKGLQHFYKRLDLIKRHPLVLERNDASLNSGGSI